MSFIIHQALFGDRENAYSLLKATPGTAIELAKRMCNSTDLHEQTPDGIRWNSTIRGFKWENYYLVIKTFFDNTPSVRKGRVFSHTLIIPEEYLSSLNNLDTLLSYFPEELSKEIGIEPITFKQTESASVLKVNGRIGQLVHNLLSSEAEVHAWVDYAEYEQAVCTIWNNAPAGIRVNLRFGLGFNPSEAIGQPGIKIVSVPERLVHKWKREEVAIIGKTDNYFHMNEAERLLLGNREGAIELNKLIEEAGIEIADFKHLNNIQRVLATANDVYSADLNSVITLINTLKYYSPNIRKGTNLKQRLIDRLINIVGAEQQESIVRLRIEQFTDFIPTNPTNRIAEVVYQIVLKLTAHFEIDIAIIVTHLTNSSVQEWWKNSVKKGLADAFRNWNSGFVGVVSQALYEDDAPKVTLLESLLPSNLAIEKDFVAQLSEKPEKVSYQAIKILALKRRWLMVLALCNASLYKVHEAFKEQLREDQDRSHLNALNFIAHNFPYQEVFKASFAFSDPRFTTISANLCIRYPILWGKLDVTSSRWQDVWLAALTESGAEWRGISDPQKTLFDILNFVVEGGEFNEALLVRLLNTEHNDLTHYPQRRIVWQALPRQIKATVLYKTTMSFLEQSTTNAFEGLELEVLETIRSGKVVRDFLGKKSTEFGKALPIFQHFVQDESYLKEYIRKLHKDISPTDSILLGKLIYEKKWKECAYSVYSQARSYPSFRKALHECYTLLGLYDRMTASLLGLLEKESFSSGEWWEALTETSIDLFPEGPRDQKVWETAGGKLSDLDLWGSGSLQWKSSLQALRSGKTNVSEKRLVNAMLEIYPDNPILKLLKHYLKII